MWSDRKVALLIFCLVLAVVAAMSFWTVNPVYLAHSPEQASNASQEQAAQDQSQSGDSLSELQGQIDEDLVKQTLGDEQGAALLATAQTNEDAAWVAANIDNAAYAQDGDAVQAKILKLAAKEPEACTFVRSFAEKYPADEQDLSATPVASSGEESAGAAAPKLYQWDPRWGSTVYSSTAFAVTGCCPTAMAMVYQGLTGDTSKTPYDMGKLASAGGYETAYDGTDIGFMFAGAQQLGLSCTEINLSYGAVQETLAGGGLIIANVGPGDFTANGHYLVIAGMKDGSLIINDPYSAVNSAQAWDMEQVLKQTKALYAFTTAS